MRARDLGVCDVIYFFPTLNGIFSEVASPGQHFACPAPRTHYQEHGDVVNTRTLLDDAQDQLPASYPAHSWCISAKTSRGGAVHHSERGHDFRQRSLALSSAFLPRNPESSTLRFLCFWICLEYMIVPQGRVIRWTGRLARVWDL